MVESYVVVGGEGFLGSNMIQMLLERYPQAAVASFDLVHRHTSGRQTFHSVDLTDLEAMTSALKQTAATCVFNTASPHIGSPLATAEKVNVEGTRTIIEACKRAGVRKLVQTSSAVVCFDGTDNINVDERLPILVTKSDPYTLTKAKAEKLVLEANGQDGLLTCAIRPSGIFGPGDRQGMPPIIQSLKDGKAGIVIGANNNLWDWTYVDNVNHAHLLAAERLTDMARPGDFAQRPAVVDLTLQRRPVPSSTRRPDGRWLSFETPVQDGAPDPPIKAMRNRLDEFSGQPNVAVAGQAFFITNGEPLCFWDHIRALHFFYSGHDNAATAFHLPVALATVFAMLSEVFAWIIGKKDPAFTRDRVKFMRAMRYHNIERARVILGYEPIVGYAEGVRRGIEWYKATEVKN